MGGYWTDMEDILRDTRNELHSCKLALAEVSAVVKNTVCRECDSIDKSYLADPDAEPWCGISQIEEILKRVGVS